MKNDSETVSETLHYFEFDKHHAHHWLFRTREQREAMLKRTHLDSIIDLQQKPIHIGDICHTESSYDWGHVTFVSDVQDLDSDTTCSVYAAFEYLISCCNIFPMFIAVSDLDTSIDNHSDNLPVFGMKYKMDGMNTLARKKLISRMLKLHELKERDEHLVDQTIELLDEDLFKQFFPEMAKKKNLENKKASVDTDNDSAYDGLSGRDFL